MIFAQTAREMTLKALEGFISPEELHLQILEATTKGETSIEIDLHGLENKKVLLFQKYMEGCGYYTAPKRLTRSYDKLVISWG